MSGNLEALKKLSLSINYSIIPTSIFTKIWTQEHNAFGSPAIQDAPTVGVGIKIVSKERYAAGTTNSFGTCSICKYI